MAILGDFQGLKRATKGSEGGQKNLKIRVSSSMDSAYVTFIIGTSLINHLEYHITDTLYM